MRIVPQEEVVERASDILAAIEAINPKTPAAEPPYMMLGRLISGDCQLWEWDSGWSVVSIRVEQDGVAGIFVLTSSEGGLRNGPQQEMESMMEKMGCCRSVFLSIRDEWKTAAPRYGYKERVVEYAKEF